MGNNSSFQTEYKEEYIEFSDIDEANDWLLNSNVYINRFSVKDRPLFSTRKSGKVQICYMNRTQSDNHVYQIEKAETYGLMTEDIEKYKRKWKRKNPDKELCIITKREVIFGQNGSSLIGFGLTNTVHFILYRKMRDNTDYKVDQNYSGYNGINHDDNFYNASLSNNGYYNDGNHINRTELNYESMQNNLGCIRYCSVCGCELTSGSIFCSGCGRRID